MKKTAAELIRQPGGSLRLRQTIEIEVPEGTSLLEAENAMQAALMEAGAGLLEEFLHGSDADGGPLQLEGERLTGLTGLRMLPGNLRVLGTWGFACYLGTCACNGTQDITEPNGGRLPAASHYAARITPRLPPPTSSAEATDSRTKQRPAA